MNRRARLVTRLAAKRRRRKRISRSTYTGGGYAEGGEVFIPRNRPPGMGVMVNMDILPPLAPGGVVVRDILRGR